MRWRKAENSQWVDYHPLFRSVTLTNGCKAERGKLLMRRKVDGQWQYREATPAEQADYVSAESW